MKGEGLPFPNTRAWAKLGRILAPDPRTPWMSTCTGSSFGLPIGDGPRCEVYVTGRDERNRSQIGRVVIDLESGRVLEVCPEALLPLGELGAFDENGVSYPFLVEHEGAMRMYYVGWMPTVLTPYQAHIGLAVREAGGGFRRVSRAPILERTNEDHLSLGSCCVLFDQDRYRMWYTAYLSWGKAAGEPKHTYVIKYAESPDGIRWKREDRVCIGISREGEFALCRPSVVKSDGGYHMWLAARGEQYKIGYAFSKDGLEWTRQDERAGIAVSESGWDSEALAYPHVFRCAGRFYMLYSGNEYGKQGLGLARLEA